MINEDGNRIYVPGDKVWYIAAPMRLDDRPDVQGEVILSFMEKGEQYLVIRTRRHPVIRLARFVWDELKGLSNQDKQLQHPDSRAWGERSRIMSDILAKLPPEAFEQDSSPE